jgi:hypothetical protein
VILMRGGWTWGLKVSVTVVGEVVQSLPCTMCVANTDILRAANAVLFTFADRYELLSLAAEKASLASTPVTHVQAGQTSETCVQTVWQNGLRHSRNRFQVSSYQGSKFPLKSLWSVQLDTALRPQPCCDLPWATRIHIHQSRSQTPLPSWLSCTVRPTRYVVSRHCQFLCIPSQLLRQTLGAARLSGRGPPTSRGLALRHRPLSLPWIAAGIVVRTLALLAS